MTRLFEEDPGAAERRLAQSEVLRRLAGRLARVGGWRIDGADRTVHWSDELHDILESPSDEGVPSLEDAVARYPAAHRDIINDALERCLTDGTPFDVELEIETFAGRRIRPRRAPRSSCRRSRAACGTSSPARHGR